MAHVLKGSRSFTCTSRVHSLTEWTIPAFAGQQKCVDRKTLIRISPWSLIKDPYPQSTAISNLESAVSPRLNVSLYSQVSK